MADRLPIYEIERDIIACFRDRGCILRLFLTTPQLGFLLVLVLVLETCKKLSEDEDENEDEEDGLRTVSRCAP